MFHEPENNPEDRNLCDPSGSPHVTHDAAQRSAGDIPAWESDL